MKKRPPSSLLTALLLTTLLAPTTAETILYSHTTPALHILKTDPNQTCPVRADGLTSTSFPWTHNPTCLYARLPSTFKTNNTGAKKEKEIFCVYTNSLFANGRGISFITTPEVATHFTADSFSHADQEERGGGLWETRETTNRGIGSFTKAKRVEAGESLMVKHPVLLISRDLLHADARGERHVLLERAMKQLPAKTERVVRGLAKSRGGDELDDVVQTNAVGMRIGPGEGSGHLGVVPEVARINHACRPNTYYRLDDYELTLDLFAIRNIEPGEELTYSYGFSDQPHASREAALEKNWGFKCACSLCSSNSTLLSTSDERLTRMANIKKVLPTDFDSIPKLITLLPNLISLMDDEGLVVEKPMYEEILAYAWSTMGMEERAKYWAERARRGWEIVAGKESWEARRMRELESDVKGHGTWMTWDKDPWDEKMWEEGHEL